MPHVLGDNNDPRISKAFPRATIAYARRLLHGDAPRHLGHNPLGAWMAIALLTCLPALAVLSCGHGID